MHQKHEENDSSGESSPWVGICVIDGGLPSVSWTRPLPASLPLSLSRNVETGSSLSQSALQVSAPHRRE